MYNSLVGDNIPPAAIYDNDGDMRVRSSAAYAVDEGAVPDGTEIYVGAILAACFILIGGLRSFGFRGLVAV